MRKPGIVPHLRIAVFSLLTVFCATAILAASAWAPYAKDNWPPGYFGAAGLGSLATAPPPHLEFTPQIRVGFSVGDQWEPDIAADAYGNIYVLYAQYGGVPGCPAITCASPTAILQVSRDRGATWQLPHPIAPSGTE